MRSIELSIVVPVFGCADCLFALYHRITKVLAGHQFEIVLVDDASPDQSWVVLRELAKSDRRVTALRLARNAGQQAAIMAGLAASRGARAVVMDCDLEDPPEWIPRLVGEAERGFDIVLTRHRGRSHLQWREIFSRIYFSLVRIRTGSPLLECVAMFSLLSRRAIDAYLAAPTAGYLHLQTLVGLPFTMRRIDYPRQARYSGHSAYNYRRLVRLFFRGIGWLPASSSSRPYFVQEFLQDGAKQ